MAGYLDPDSLVNLVLKDTYIWRGFVWGKEIITKGSRWQIDNGKSVDIMQDQRIPRSRLFSLIDSPSLPECIKVFDFKLASGEWNVNLIGVMLIKKYAEAIIQIPCTVREVPNSLIWHFRRTANTRCEVVIMWRWIQLTDPLPRVCRRLRGGGLSCGEFGCHKKSGSLLGGCARNGFLLVRFLQKEGWI